MKKFLFVMLLGFGVGLASCQKDEDPNTGTITYASLTVTVPQGISSRAAADYGDASNINRCILEVYRNGELYGERQIATVVNQQATFADLQLVVAQDYDFVLWADCADGNTDKHYNTTDLSAITLNDSYSGNNDEFDAFYAKKTFTITNSFSEGITLTRPFGQLNVKTDDLAAIQHDDLKPTDIEVSFTSIPTSFNAQTGEVGNYQPISYTTEIEDAASGELTIDYILATPDQAALADFSMTFYNEGTKIVTNDKFTNIPIRRNYRTNVSGNLITTKGDLVVTINPDFETPDYYWGTALLEAATNGGTITLQSDVVFDENTPALVVAPGKTMIVNLNGHEIISKDPNKDGIMVNGGTLIINGDENGGINANEGYYAIWAVGDAQVTINGGNYVGNGSCIQAKDNAHIEINDGYFKVNQAYNDVYFVVNLQDNQPNTITIKGGKFENCNPAETGTEPAGVSDNFVAEGYSSVKISDTPAPNGVYEVVKGVGVANMSDMVAAIETIGENGGEITIVESANIDISSFGASLEINKPTTITLDGTITSTNEAVQIVNNSELILKGTGTVNMQKSVVENHGTLTVEGGNYTTSTLTGGIIFWNNAENAVMTLNNVNAVASYFAVAGMGTININGGSIESVSSNKNGAWAYCIRAQQGGTMTIKDAEIKGVQGCIAAIEGSHIILDNVKAYAKNSEPGLSDAFYSLYAASLGVIEVLSGEYYSDRTPCALASDDDQAGAPLGGLILKGGKYSSQPMNDLPSPEPDEVWPAADGYKYQKITDDPLFKWEIVAQ